MGRQSEKKTPLSRLGEFGLIDHITSWAGLSQPTSLKGVGDDAAVLDYRGSRLVLTTDLLLEGIHFNLVYTPLRHLGYKSIVVNLSDVLAMNAIPRQVTVSLGISSKLYLEDIEELYQGIRLACERYGVDLVGGDISASMTGLLISVTAVGEADPHQVVYRNGAKPGDLICVTGDLGAAYLGLQVLERENRLFSSGSSVQPVLEGYDYILERQLKPEVRLDLIEYFHREGIRPGAMIDISDGLSSDLLHICHASGTGCRLQAERIPVHPDTRKAAEEFSMEPETAALNGGEDYELLFTLPAGLFEKLAGIKGITAVGEITSKDGGPLLVTRGGGTHPLTAQGWDQVK